MLLPNQQMPARSGWLFIGLIMILLLLAACNSSAALAPTAPPTESPTATPEPPTATPEPPTATPEPSTATPEPPTPTPAPPTPTPEPPTATPEASGDTAGGGSGSGQVDFDQIFPPGHEPERDSVINSCGRCHSSACPVIGQLSKERWKTVETNHRDYVSGMSDENYALLFIFLAENFNDTKPAPDLPEAMISIGCTANY